MTKIKVAPQVPGARQDMTKPDIERLILNARSSIENGRFNQAEIFYRIVLGHTAPPENALERIAHGEASMYFAEQRHQQGKLGEAGDWYRQAIAADPMAVDYRVDLITKILIPIGLIQAAHQEAKRAVQIDPRSARAWRALGNIEYELGHPEAVKRAYDKVMELEPDAPLSWLNQASLALDTADYDRVASLCAEIVKRWPEKEPDATHLLAMIAYREGRHELAIPLFNKAIEGGCFEVELARWNRSLPLQSIGRYKEGWADAEARGTQKQSVEFGIALRRFNRPLLNLAEHSPPARVHIHEEMGFGDTIAMLRYLPLLVERGFSVTVELREEIEDLARFSLPPEIKVIPKAPDYPGAIGIPDFDYHHSLLSLPFVFETTVETIPWHGPYLKAEPELVAGWQGKLGHRRKIGLCWSAGIRAGVWLGEYGRRKSLPRARLAPLIELCSKNDWRAVSLQAGPEADEADGLPGLGKEPGSWSDTAALIECCDVVVTVDTAVAHLAGAMGKPVLLAMHTESSWHWMSPRPNAAWNTRSPWYPTIEIIRQSQPHDWVDVVKNIATELGSRMN